MSRQKSGRIEHADRRRVPGAATAVPGALLRLVCLTCPKGSPWIFSRRTSRKFYAVAGGDPGSVAAVDVADARLAAGRSPASQSSEASAVRCRDAVTTATLTSARVFCRNFYEQPSGSRRLTARRLGICNICGHVGTIFDMWVDSKCTSRRRVLAAVP